MANHLIVMVKNSPNLEALMKKIKLPLYMVQLVEIGLEKFDCLILTNDVVRNKILVPNDTVVFHPKKMMRFPMDFASDK